MLKRRSSKGSQKARITFALAADDPRLPASVVGDFNHWDPEAHPLRPRSNRTWSVVVELDRGKLYRFRYHGADGTWFDDEEADGFEANEFASSNCILRT